MAALFNHACCGANVKVRKVVANNTDNRFPIHGFFALKRILVKEVRACAMRLLVVVVVVVVVVLFRVIGGGCGGVCVRVCVCVCVCVCVFFLFVPHIKLYVPKHSWEPAHSSPTRYVHTLFASLNLPPRGVLRLARVENKNKLHTIGS